MSVLALSSPSPLLTSPLLSDCQDHIIIPSESLKCLFAALGIKLSKINFDVALNWYSFPNLNSYLIL